MARLPILTYPDPRLKKTCRPVKKVDEKIRRLVHDLAETMYAAPGVGLAAPQVGENLRIIVCDPKVREANRGELIALINPEIVGTEGRQEWEEGCLSCPEMTVPTVRAAKIKVVGLNPEGESVAMEAEGYPAVILQHEIDHLDGGLIVDHLSSLKRSLYRRRLRRLRTEK